MRTPPINLGDGVGSNTEGGGACLSAWLRAHNTAALRRFLADEGTRVDLAAPGHAAPHGAPTGHTRIEQARGKSVLLAVPGQLAAAIALIELDGVARRLVLCPPDVAQTHRPAVLQSADVDMVVTEWPLPGAGVRLWDEPAVAPVPQATEWVLFTSGTTGQPKMVSHSLESLAGHLRHPAMPVPSTGDGPVWCTFYDTRRYGGLQILLRALVAGGSLVLSCAGEAPGAFLARAAAAGATHFLGTPSHWRRALMTDAAHLISPSYVRLSGEVADQILLDRLRATYPGARIVHAFAATEAGLAFEVTDGLAGFPASMVGGGGLHAEIDVRDGALLVRSARTAAGYLDGTVTPIAGADGFVDTGDIVVRQGSRYYFAGRRDGTVNVGGQKVHPEEVEAVINRHPGVRMSLVRARSNPITGAIVVADIVIASDAAGSRPAGGASLQDDVRAFCRAHLAPHKVPAAIRIVPNLDIAASGKLVRARA
jgi:acyl-coenzyme A synthetase/AMP-(fatty) acid ligase